MTVEDRTGLERELRFYNEHRQEYLERFPGLYVLIRGEEMHGPFPSAEAAYTDGLRLFGMQPFLVKQVLGEVPVGFAPVFFAAAPAGRAGL